MKNRIRIIILAALMSLVSFSNVAYQNSINQNDIQKFELLGSHKNGKVDEKANKFVLPSKREVKKWKK